jgi:sterol desaturase/sphingolipid hydroxylase (fatty acid hydroxylase superfamily)
MTGSSEPNEVKIFTVRKGKSTLEYPWWVQSYPKFVYVSCSMLLTLILTISYIHCEGNQMYSALKWLTAAATYGYALDQCSLVFCHMKGRTPIARPGLELMFMIAATLYSSCIGSLSGSPFLFLCLVVVRDVYAILSWELARVVESIDVQENDLRIYDTVTPYLKKPLEAVLVLLNIPFQDGLTIWLSIYLGFVIPLKDFKLRMVLLMPLKHFIGDLVNDAFYYSMHTSLHTPRWYSHHKLHHMVKHPTGWCAGIMNWQEMLETFLVTRIFTPIILYYVFGPWYVPEFLMYNVYLGVLEIGGHTGCVGGSSVLFRTGTSIIMNPLGIQLEVGHHDLHHELFNVNFGKRCSLYDKMFATFMDCKLKVPSYEGGSTMLRTRIKK